MVVVVVVVLLLLVLVVLVVVVVAVVVVAGGSLPCATAFILIPLREKAGLDGRSVTSLKLAR